MKRILVIALMLVSMVAYGQPTISGVSGGALTHNEAVTISGGSFGTKTLGTSQQLWDSVEDGILNPEYLDISGLAPSGVTSVPAIFNETISGRHPNSQYSYFANLYGGGDAVFTVSGMQNAGKWFTSYWFKMGDDFDLPPIGENFLNMSNTKMWRLFPTGSQNENLYILSSRRYSSDNSVLKIEYVETEGPRYLSAPYAGSHWDSDKWMDGGWHHAQWQFSDNDFGQANGTIKMWVDGQLWMNWTDLRTREDYDVGRRIRIGWENSASGSFTGNEDGIDSFYLDDIYADDQWTRVEIGNNSVYESCTQREMQPVTSWVDDSIGITVNLGSFDSSESLYLFVTDEDGNQSSGQSVTMTPKPTITRIDKIITNTDPVDIDGTLFGATKGSGSVVMGSASTYAGSATKTTQSTTSWSETAITFTTNTTGFSSYDNVWIYVLDDAGNVSVGYGKSVGTNPAPTGISDVFENGTTISVTGTGFGTKNGAHVGGGPILWDNFEEGTNLASLATTNTNWEAYSEADDNGPRYRSARSYSGSLSVGNTTLDIPTSGGFDTVYYDFPRYSDFVFASYKLRMDGWSAPTSGYTNVADFINIKLHRIHRGVGTYYSSSYGLSMLSTVASNLNPHYAQAHFHGTNDAAGDDWTDKKIQGITNNWFHIEHTRRLSTPDVSDGFEKVNFFMPVANTLGRVRQSTEYNPVTNRLSAYPYQNKSFLMGVMYAGFRTNGDFHVQIYNDDVYLDDTWARVFIGDNITYDNCKFIELQKPVSWTTSSISIVVNTGQFTNGEQAFLFVAGEDGNVNSSGMEITINSQVVVTAPGEVTSVSAVGN